MNTILEVIKEKLIDLEYINSMGDVDYTTTVEELGIDSMGILALITELEDYYNVMIPDSELLLENFYNLQAIVNTFHRYKEVI